MTTKRKDHDMPANEDKTLNKDARLEGIESSVDLATGNLGDLWVGNIGVRLATNPAEIEAAQKLRYKIFYEEIGGQPSEEAKKTKRDISPLDEYCDHLLVIDRSKEENLGVVGTYRLARKEAAEKHGSFYTESEYNIDALLAYHGNILEVARSCVDIDYRTRPVMQLLWRGLAAYVFHYNIDLLFGCASFPGTNVDDHAAALTYLYYNHLAPPGLRPRTRDEHYVDMKILPSEQVDPERELLHIPLLRHLPPVLKGYMRLGAYVGDGAFIDYESNLTDVCVVLKTDMMSDRYFRHYERSTRNAWNKQDE